MGEHKRTHFADQGHINELHERIRRLTLENEELLTFVDESVQIAEDYKSQMIEHTENENSNLDGVAKFALALYEYAARDNAELSLKIDEVVHILHEQDDDGFYKVQNAHSEIGLVPSNFVKILNGQMLQKVIPSEAFYVQLNNEMVLEWSFRPQPGCCLLWFEVTCDNVRTIIPPKGRKFRHEGSRHQVQICSLFLNDARDHVLMSKPNPIFVKAQNMIVDLETTETSVKILFSKLVEPTDIIHYGRCGSPSVISRSVQAEEVIIQNLKPETRYFLRIHAETYYFQTARQCPSKKPKPVDNFHCSRSAAGLMVCWDKYTGNAAQFLLLTDVGVIGQVNDIEAECCQLPPNVDPKDLKICAVDENGVRSEPTTMANEDQSRSFIVEALFDYVPSKMSPNVDSTSELTFRKGDIFTVIGAIGNDGYYTGVDSKHNTGLIPSNFVQPASRS